MKKFIEDLTQFFKKNWIKISFVIVALFLILAIVAIKNIEFKRHPNKALEKIILYEKFRGREGFKEGVGALKEEPPKGAAAGDKKDFCNRSPVDKERACFAIKEKKCKLMDCCIWAKAEFKDPACYAGDIHGAQYEAPAKSLEWWWYKGKKYTKDEESEEEGSEAFAPANPEAMPPAKDAPESTQNAVDQREKEEEAHLDAADTLEQIAAIRQAQGRKKRELSQKHEVEDLLQQHSHINQNAARQQADDTANLVAKTEEQTVQALKVLANKQKVKMNENELGELQLQHSINNTLANNASESGKISAADEVASAKSRIDIESKKRELSKLANQAKQQKQGELVGGEAVDGAIEPKELAEKVTPESTGKGKKQKEILSALQSILNKKGKSAEQLSKLGTGSGNPLGNLAAQMAGKVQSGFTNYFRQ
jgi:hypothetical protein